MLAFMFLLNTDVLSVCCGIAFGGHYSCKDGSMTWTCCGSHSGGFGGCNIFCCHCDGGCKKPKTYEQCIKGCEGAENLCEGGCDLAPSPGCDEACEDAQSQCEDGCRG